MCVAVAKAARGGGEKLVQLKIVVGGDCGRLSAIFSCNLPIASNFQ